jgi:hypothetical protein
VPASSAVHIRLHQNGVFYGLYSLIEQVGSDSLHRVDVPSSALPRAQSAERGLTLPGLQVDDTFLRRHGLDVDGGLWKAVHWKVGVCEGPREALESQSDSTGH